MNVSVIITIVINSHSRLYIINVINSLQHFIAAAPDMQLPTHTRMNKIIIIIIAVTMRLGMAICVPHNCHCGSSVDAHMVFTASYVERLQEK